jgi:hypothetical protein
MRFASRPFDAGCVTIGPQSSTVERVMPGKRQSKLEVALFARG